MKVGLIMFIGITMSFRILHAGAPVAYARVVMVYDNKHYKQHQIEHLYDVENGKTISTPMKTVCLRLLRNEQA